MYAHVRNDTGDIFYIGVGIGNRAYHTRKRNIFWSRVVSKTSYSIRILFSGLTHQESRLKEMRLIKLLGRRDLGLGTLVNLTDGGDGCYGYVATADARKKISIANANRKISEKTRLKLIEYHTQMGISPSRQKLMQERRRVVGWHQKTKAVICTLTGVQYSSVKEAAVVLGLNRHCLSRMLRGERKNSTTLSYK